MMLLKRATLLLCLSLSACSSVDKEAPSVALPAEPVVDLAWLDDYEPRLRAALEGSDFEVERRNDLLVVIAPVDRSFNPDRPGMLLPVTLGPIAKVAKMLENDGKTAVVVVGHADDSGEAEAVKRLSRERAGAVGAIFRLSGFKAERLQIRGMGADMPRVANDSQAGRALNRRVEMVLAPQATLLTVLAGYETTVSSPAQVTALAEQPQQK